MMTGTQNRWRPKHIDIEPSFNAFVITFRGGRLIRDLMPDLSKMGLNADYLFPKDNTIVELKCLVKDPLEETDWPSRVSRAFRSSGHSLGDLMGCLFRGEAIPDRVREKLVHWLREALRGVVKTGNRQVRQSKRDLGRVDAKGILLIANDNNYGFTPAVLVGLIGDAAARLEDNHLNAIVYFTPNVFHRKEGSDVAWVLWEPRYRDDMDDQLSDFVNDLGRKWNDYTAAITGDPFVDREEVVSSNVSKMQVVRRFRRRN